MKLLFCRKCQDVVKLIHVVRPCRCGKARGKYINEVTVEVTGEAEVIGLCNFSLLRALREQPARGEGPELKAWLFAVKHERIKKER